MPSIAELRKKIRGVQSTRQITNAMRMVAGARFTRAQRTMIEATRFNDAVKEIVAAVVPMMDSSGKYASLIAHPGNIVSFQSLVGIVAIGGDKGLCGDFNTKILKQVEKTVQEKGAHRVCLFAIGTKTSEWCRSLGTKTLKRYPNIFRSLSYKDAQNIGRTIMQETDKWQIGELIFIYTSFISAIRQKLIVSNVLPIVGAADRATIECEPRSPAIIFDFIYPLYITSTLYAAMRHSYASELAARMRAMDNATRNAGIVIEDLILETNKVRQAIITRELAELTGTSEVMKDS